jgi:hypothetical protein
LQKSSILFITQLTIRLPLDAIVSSFFHDVSPVLLAWFEVQSAKGPSSVATRNY